MSATFANLIRNRTRLRLICEACQHTVTREPVSGRSSPASMCPCVRSFPAALRAMRIEELQGAGGEQCAGLGAVSNAACPQIKFFPISRLA